MVATNIVQNAQMLPTDLWCEVIQLLTDGVWKFERKPTLWR